MSTCNDQDKRKPWSFPVMNAPNAAGVLKNYDLVIGDESYVQYLNKKIKSTKYTKKRFSKLIKTKYFLVETTSGLYIIFHPEAAQTRAHAITRRKHNQVFATTNLGSSVYLQKHIQLVLITKIMF